MKPAWIGNALLATSWLLGLNYYHQADWLAWTVAVMLGTICMGWTPLAVPARSLALASGLLLLPAAWIAPWPHKAGLILAAIGCLLVAVRGGGRWLERVGAGTMISGMVLLAQSLTIVAYRHLTARFADLPEALTALLALLARLTGIEVVADGSRLVMYSMREMHPLAATWGLLVDPVSPAFLVGGIVLLLISRADAGRQEVVRSVAVLGAAVMVWLPCRTVLLMAVYLHRTLRTEYGAELDLLGQFWSPWMHLALLGVPLAIAYGVVSARGHGRPRESAARAAVLAPAARLRAQPLLAAGWVGGGTFLLTAAMLWAPTGQRKGGRVLVDDYHSGQSWPMKEYDTTRTDKPFDTTWYGRDSSYNYACIYDYGSRIYQMARQTQPLTDAALSQCDVVVLKDPSAPYAQAEKEAIRRFLARGGGVLFLGDHTSVFGSGVNLNDLTEEFGFRYRYDCAFGVDSVFDQTYVPPLAPHPIVQHVRTMEFATSCTLEVGTRRGRAPMLCTGLKSLEADYHTSNFYPQPRNRPEMRCGAFVQMWATRHGQGRIVAFTDSTIFSNFCAFEPGKRELMVGMIEWLNHANAWGGWAWTLGVLGAVGILGGIGVLRGGSWGRGGNAALLGGVDRGQPGSFPRAWVLAVAAGTFAWSLAVVGVRAAHAHALPFPQAVRPLTMVAIDQTVSDARLPKNGFISGGAAGAASRYTTEFGQLERSILRLGLFCKRAVGDEALQADLIIVPFPNEEDQTVVRAYGNQLAEYVRRGGKVLILDAPENAQSRANSLLFRFGLGVKRGEGPTRGSSTQKPPLVVREPWPSPLASSSLEVTGGTPFVWFDGRPAAAWKQHGQGVVCVVGFGARFRDDQMGPGADVEPQGEMKEVFGLLFALLPAVAKGQLPADGPVPAAATHARAPAYVASPSAAPTNYPPRPGSMSNVAFPAGWSTNPALRAQMLTNPVYRTWYSNYVKRSRGMTNLPAAMNRAEGAGGGSVKAAPPRADKSVAPSASRPPP